MPTTGHHYSIAAEVMRQLRQERKRLGLSNYAVSKRSGVSQSMLSLLDQGLRNPTLETLLKIADALEADLPAILRRATSRARKHKRSASN